MYAQKVLKAKSSFPRSCRWLALTAPVSGPPELSRTTQRVIAARPARKRPAKEKTAKIVLAQWGSSDISQSKLARENETAKRTMKTAERRTRRRWQARLSARSWASEMRRREMANRLQRARKSSIRPKKNGTLR